MIISLVCSTRTFGMQEEHTHEVGDRIDVFGVVGPRAQSWIAPIVAKQGSDKGQIIAQGYDEQGEEDSRGGCIVAFVRHPELQVKISQH